MSSSQSPRSPVVKTERGLRRKLRGASLLSDHAWLEIGRVLGLTKRELQIVQGVFDNLPKAGIAKRLGISGHTVHTHLNRLFKKLAVTTRTELVLRIMEQLIALTISETAVLPPICRHQHAGGCCLHNPPAPSTKVQDAIVGVLAISESCVGQMADLPMRRDSATIFTRRKN